MNDFPSLVDQFGAVLSAPIPFVIVWGVTSVFIWRCFEWRYGAVIEKFTTVLGLASKEAELAKAKQKDLETTVAALTKDLAKASKSKDQFSNVSLKEASEMLALASKQLEELGNANTTLHTTISGAPSRLGSKNPFMRSTKDDD